MRAEQLAVAVLVVILAGVSAAGQTGGGGLDGVPVVQINGASFTRADLDARNPALLFQARNAHYEAERRAVEEFIDRYLLERQAEKEGVTVAELLQRHVNNSAGLKDPSEEALRVYYEGIDTKEPYEAVRGKILEVVRQRRQMKAKTAYMQSLRSQAAIAVRLPAPRAAISLKDTPLRGVPDAPVILVEYADYECTYCRQIKPVLDRLLAEYSGKLAIAFKDAPLPNHANAQKAAEAAHCAGQQSRFWEYHDLLFAGGEYSAPKLREVARTLKLDGPNFDKCLDSGLHADRVATQLAEAQSLGVPGTPTFFLNGRMLSPKAIETFDAFRQAVEEELREVSKRAEVPDTERKDPGALVKKKG